MNSATHAHMMGIAASVLLTSGFLAAQVPATTNVRGSHHHYKLIDVGTFGGPNTFVDSPNPGEVLINQRGLVVGAADTPNADPYNPNCLLDCSLVHAFAWKDGVLRDLGALSGTNNSFAFSSNNRRQVVGLSETGTLDPVTGYPTVHAVLWSHGEIVDLGALGGSVSWAGTINDRGQVAGASFNTVQDPFGGSLAVPSPFAAGTQLRAFLWEDGVMKDLGTLGGPDSEAQYINERGQVVGQSLTNSIPNPPIAAPGCQTAGIPTQHPFLWQGSLIDLGSLGGTCGYANWLTNEGQVVGTMTLAGDTVNHAFLWDRGMLTDLGTLGGNNSEAYRANDAGQVVGRADFSPNSTNHHAFLWTRGVMKDLGTPNGLACSTAEAINANAQVVGDAGVCLMGGNGWLWEDGSIVDLNSLVSATSNVHVAGAVGINDRGEIVAEGSPMPANGTSHVVVLIPCDEKHPGIEGCDYSMVDADR